MRYLQNNRWLLLFVLLVLILAALPSVVSAADAQAAGFKSLDTIIDTFANSAKSWVYYFRDKALSLFWPLATVAFLLMVIPHLFRLDLAGLMSELVRYLITTGFFYWLILSTSPLRPYNLINIFTKSFTQMAAEATGNIAPEQLSPSGIIGIGLSIVFAVWQTVSLGDIPGSMITILSSMFIAIIFVFIAAKMTVLLIELWIKAYISPFVLGFGAWSGTRDIALNYLRSMGSLGLKVMTYGLIVGVGQSVVSDVCATIMSPRTATVVANWRTAYEGRGSTMEVTTNIITNSDLLVMMSLGFVLLITSESIPNFISGLIGNAGASGASAITIGSTMAAGRTAAGVATGGVGTVAAGVSGTANLARQTAAQSQAGEGILFKNLPGSGESGMLKSFAKAKGTAGIGGLAAYGASFGLGMAKNALSAAATAAATTGSRTSMGTLDAAVKLNMAKDNNARATETKGGAGAVVKTLGKEEEPSTGKISGQSSSAKSDMTPTAQVTTSGFQQKPVDSVNSHGVTMQQSVAHVAGAMQQNTEQMIVPNSASASNAASATPNKTSQVLPTEPPPLSQAIGAKEASVVSQTTQQNTEQVVTQNSPSAPRAMSGTLGKTPLEPPSLPPEGP